MWSFQGKVALLTGAGSGMGLTTTRGFAAAGAAVALADANEEAVRLAANELVAAGSFRKSSIAAGSLANIE
jgi:NAD(P)-dependent dehydrogenase (short-subunit alcohol dehydrogenase family)